MSARESWGAIEHHKVRWVRDGLGIAHAVKQSEGVHCSAYCRKYVRGEWFIVGKGELIPSQCPVCCDRLERPVVLASGPQVPSVVLMGRGVQNELRRRAKGRD